MLGCRTSAANTGISSMTIDPSLMQIGTRNGSLHKFATTRSFVPPSGTIFLTLEEVVERYRGQVSEGTLRNWRSMRIGPSFIKIGKAILYPLEELDRRDRRSLGRLLKNLVLERFSWRCGSKKRSDGSRSALHRRRWLRFCLIFDAPDGLIPLRPEAWGRERDCRRQQSGRRTIPPSRAHDAGSCANRRRSSSSQRVLRSACA